MCIQQWRIGTTAASFTVQHWPPAFAAPQLQNLATPTMYEHRSLSLRRVGSRSLMQTLNSADAFSQIQVCCSPAVVMQGASKNFTCRGRARIYEHDDCLVRRSQALWLLGVYA